MANILGINVTIMIYNISKLYMTKEDLKKLDYSRSEVKVIELTGDLDSEAATEYSAVLLKQCQSRIHPKILIIDT